MADKMDRFSAQSQKVFGLAQAEAERLKHSAIGTEHLLLALLIEKYGVAYAVLRLLALTHQKVEERALQLIPPGANALDAPLQLTVNLKRVLELSVDEARRMGYHYVGVEHLLLGLVRQAECKAVEILKLFTLSPETVRRQMRRVLQGELNPPDSQSSVPQANQTYRNFTQRAHRVLDLAREAALSLQQNAIGSEHLFIGLAKEEHGLASRVLRDLGVDQEKLVLLVAGLNKPAVPLLPARDFNPAAQHVFELAQEEASYIGQQFIGTEHLLLGLIRQANRVVLDVLQRLGLERETVRSAVLRLVANSPSQKTSAQAPESVANLLVTARKPMPDTEYFRLAHNMLEQIMRMLEIKAITPEQGKELLEPLITPIRLMPGERAKLTSLLRGKLERGRVQLILTEKGSDEIKLATQLSLETVFRMIDVLIKSALADHPSIIQFDDIDIRVRLEYIFPEDPL